MRAMLCAIMLILCGLSAWAAPRQYVLDAPRSLVVFTWFLGDDPVRGSMSVRRADLRLDFDQVANSTIDVALDATQAQAGFARDEAGGLGRLGNGGAFVHGRDRDHRAQGGIAIRQRSRETEQHAFPGHHGVDEP